MKNIPRSRQWKITLTSGEPNAIPQHYYVFAPTRRLAILNFRFEYGNYGAIQSCGVTQGKPSHDPEDNPNNQTGTDADLLADISDLNLD